MKPVELATPCKAMGKGNLDHFGTWNGCVSLLDVVFLTRVFCTFRSHEANS